MQRRTLLRRAAAIGTIAVAGCAESSGSRTTHPPDVTAPRTTTGTPTRGDKGLTTTTARAQDGEPTVLPDRTPKRPDTVLGFGEWFASKEQKIGLRIDGVELSSKYTVKSGDSGSRSTAVTRETPDGVQLVFVNYTLKNISNDDSGDIPPFLQLYHDGELYDFGEVGGINAEHSELRSVKRSRFLDSGETGENREATTVGSAASKSELEVWFNEFENGEFGEAEAAWTPS